MIYSQKVQEMCPVAKGAKHEPAPIPEEGKWIHAKKIEDISGFTHGIGWCAPQQGACKLSLNVKNGVIEEALIEKKLVSETIDVTLPGVSLPVGGIHPLLPIWFLQMPKDSKPKA